MSQQFSLLKEKKFYPLFWTQFLTAFNDNVFKNTIFILFTFSELSSHTPWSGELLTNLAAALFILPFLLFSSLAGQLSDHFEKSRLIFYCKLSEIFITMIAGIALYYNKIELLLLSLFLLGSQAAFIGPLKYSIIPQHLKKSELIGGNALIETGTFMAILLGTILGGLLITFKQGPLIVGLLINTISLLGCAISLSIPKAPSATYNKKIYFNIFKETYRQIKLSQKERSIFLSIIGLSWFWLYGAVFLSQIPSFTKEILKGNPHIATLLMIAFALGIGLGSLSCEKLSDKRIELGLVPLGSIGLSLFALDLINSSHGLLPHYNSIGHFLQFKTYWHILIDLFLMGAFGGFYTVPLYALLQQRSDEQTRSRIIASNNILNALFMIMGAIGVIILFKMGLNNLEVFMVIAFLNALVAIYIYSLLPEFLMRFLIWILIHTMYKVTHQNLQSIPEHGPAVIVCNHVSFVDALVISAVCRRPIRFVVDHRIFHNPLLKFIFKSAKAIPIASSKENEAIKIKAFDLIEEALLQEDLVGIFPEGQLTNNGEINPFKNGIEYIIKRTPVPVIPLALQGLWGSFFSRKYGKAMKKFPKNWWAFKIGIVAGQAIPAEQVSALALFEKVKSLRGDNR
ncbi:MAG: putative acyltransferase family protein [Francisellaceae bacterium]|nr:putative acyltransferase family protein [Francisellaceae bacterium]